MDVKERKREREREKESESNGKVFRYILGIKTDLRTKKCKLTKHGFSTFFWLALKQSLESYFTIF